jgi:hypothetical protein
MLSERAEKKMSEWGVKAGDREAVAQLIVAIKRTNNIRNLGACDAATLAEDARISTQKLRVIVGRYGEALKGCLGGTLEYMKGGYSASGNGPFARYGQAPFG